MRAVQLPRAVKGILMSAASTNLPTPDGPGSVSGVPNLPAGFTDTFASRYIDTVSYYVGRLASNPEALHGSFAWYRAIHTTIAQNQQRKERRRPCPCWRSAARRALVRWSGTRCSSSQTTCRP